MCMPMCMQMCTDVCVTNMGSVSCNVWHSVDMKKNEKNAKQNKEHKQRQKAEHIWMNMLLGVRFHPSVRYREWDMRLET